MEETLTPRRRDVGGLSTIQFDGPQGAATIVLFHGYGADAADLAPLAFELDLPTPARWAFPDAPLPLEGGVGRAWFSIDVSAIERAQRTGQSVDLSGPEPAGLAQARVAAGRFLQELGVPWSRLILGGFSQGAMLAVDLALRAPENPRGLIILSGNLLCADSWRKLAAARKGLPFFQSHGRSDPILGYAGARKLEVLLTEAGLEGSLLNFDGGHAIAPIVLERMREFLSRLA